jgi:23S rRNA pseudouridine955/2504/2580 synthase
MSTIAARMVDSDEAGMRLDRWFKLHYPGLGFVHLQKLLRSGQVRVDGARVKSDTRIGAGQAIRIPPAVANLDGGGKRIHQLTASTIRDLHDGDALTAMILHEDQSIFVFNKPAGLAVQGGSGIARHVDSMLESFRNRRGEKPRLVHRLDRETSGVLVVARTRSAAVALTAAFRQRSTRKIYWAICRGVPQQREGRISTWLVKERTDEGDRMRVANHGEPGADHAETLYRVIDTAGQNLSWLELTPITGRTHQLRVHTASIGHPIIGDPKYFNVENWELPRGIQNKLHLHAHRIRIPHPEGGIVDVSAPLAPHMRQTFNLLGFDTDREVAEN